MMSPEERAVQATFNKVINARLYRDTGKLSYMCFSLNEAFLQEVITFDEMLDALAAIREYMNYLGRGQDADAGAYLGDCLRRAGLRWAKTERKRIYRNWYHRPRLN